MTKGHRGGTKHHERKIEGCRSKKDFAHRSAPIVSRRSREYTDVRITNLDITRLPPNSVGRLRFVLMVMAGNDTIHLVHLALL